MDNASLYQGRAVPLEPFLPQGRAWEGRECPLLMPYSFIAGYLPIQGDGYEKVIPVPLPDIRPLEDALAILFYLN